MDWSRSNASPMDFAWDNRTGQVDQTSGFGRLAAQAQHQQPHAGIKRSFNSFSFSANNQSEPSLRQPNSQPHFFSQESPVPMPSPSRNTSFTTPRKPSEIDFSSGGETPNSPTTSVDSDATPERMGGFRNMFQGFGKGQRKEEDNSEAMQTEPSTERKGSIAKILSKPSPGKGTIPRGNFSNKLIPKVHKNRRKQGNLELIRRKGSIISESEPEEPSPNKKKAPKSDTDTSQPAAPNHISSLFSWIESHPHLPHILSYYAQLLLNVFLVLFIIYLIYSFWTTIRSDVNEASSRASAELLAEMAVCARNYRENRCEPKEQRVPAMESVCSNWDRCMNQDPKSVGRARVSAHTFAEIFNGFVEPISYKAMIFTFVLVFGCLAASNFAFGFWRNHRGVETTGYTTQQPPPTPQRNFSGEQNVYTPFRNQVMLEPGTGFAGGVEPGSPSRRLAYY
ncbi:MAG: hypothetical protein M1820_005813 [Bogoriella megaspora]|nr:MAG: hypothetical protein M1820_005813 [Bogoriella megaspora]